MPVTGSASSAANTVVTGGGQVYLTNDDYIGEQRVYALNGATGVSLWSQDLGSMTNQSPAAYANGHVYIESVDRNANYVFTDLSAATGASLKTYSLAAQFYPVSQPVAANGLMVAEAGDNNVWPTGFSTTSSMTYLWSVTPSDNGVSGFETPAMDSTYLYNYTGSALDVFTVADGKLAFTIGDPAAITPVPVRGEYNGAPMIGAQHDIITYTGTDDSASPQPSGEGRGSGRYLSSFDLNARKVSWKTSGIYYTTPAMANGVIYAARNTPASELDAISETDGHVLWSWTPPAGETFQRNTIVTNNLVFVSTNANIYAIDLTSHAKVWSFGTPGALSMGADLLGVMHLYIVEDVYSPVIEGQLATGTVVAVRLQ